MLLKKPNVTQKAKYYCTSLMLLQKPKLHKLVRKRDATPKAKTPQATLKAKCYSKILMLLKKPNATPKV